MNPWRLLLHRAPSCWLAPFVLLMLLWLAMKDKLAPSRTWLPVARQPASGRYR